MDRQKPEREDQREHGFGEKSDFRLSLRLCQDFKKEMFISLAQMRRKEKKILTWEPGAGRW